MITPWAKTLAKYAATALILTLTHSPIARAQELSSPTFLNPTPDVPIAYSACEAGADLIGFDLRFQDRPVNGPIPEFCVGIPTEMNLHWVYRSRKLREQQLILRWKGSAAEVIRTFPIEPLDWIIGGQYSQRIQVDVPRFTHAGDGTFTIALSCPGDSGSETVLYIGKSLTHQILTTSSFPEERITKFFGPTATRLKTSFRLAAGARVPITPKTPIANPISTIAVISALQHSYRFEQGKAVMKLSIFGADGSVREVYVHAGVETSLSEYDVPRPGSLHIAPVEIIESRPHPGDRVTWDGKPLMINTYAAKIALRKPMIPIRIEAEYLSDTGAIDVFDLVLIPE